MKLIRKVLAAAAALLMLCGCAAYAQGEGDTRFEGKTWEQTVEDFLYQQGVDAYKVTLGYCNLTTGEEHYYEANKPMIAASVYKVPLNMYFNDLIANGELTADTVMGLNDITYEDLLRETIVNSDNEMAGTLMQYVGGYRAMRSMFCRYMGLDPDTADDLFLTQDYFTARQMIECLKQLYGGSERYAKIIDYMKQAEPNNYFRFNTQNYEVAQKYGFLREEYHEYLNCCALVYTDEPIAIVMFSDTLSGGYDTMAQFCTLMCDYTQYTIAQRQADEEAAKAEKVEEKTAQRQAVAASAPEPIVIEKSTAAGFNVGSAVAAVLSLAVAAALLALVIKLSRVGRVKLLWGLLAVLLLLSALLLCVVGAAAGTVVAKPKGDPQQTVTAFFDAVCAQDYPTAYACLKNCESLGLENSPETESGRLVYDALRDSYSYELYGQCVVDKLTAYQQLRFDYLDLTSFEGDMQEQTMKALRKLVQSMSRNEIYDENDQYRPEITQQAYMQALSEAMENVEAYYTTTWLTVKLEYSGGQWYITPDPAMLKAVIGGVTY